MIITNLYENTNPSHHYHEQVAEKLTAGLQSNDDILDAAWDIVVKDLGRTVARNKFMDDDFESDLITAYKQLHKQGVTEGWKEDAEAHDEFLAHARQQLQAAHPQERPALAVRLSNLEKKHFGDEVGQGWSDTGIGRPSTGLSAGIEGILNSIGNINNTSQSSVQNMPFGSVTTTRLSPEQLVARREQQRVEQEEAARREEQRREEIRRRREQDQANGEYEVDPRDAFYESLPERIKLIKRAIKKHPEMIDELVQNFNDANMVDWHIRDILGYYQYMVDNGPTDIEGYEDARMTAAGLEESHPAGAVDTNGRTQQEWMQAVKKAYPDARIIQAKMIDGPAQALLADGRKITWTADHTMTEARAASASFRAGNKKRAELNDMTPEERKAYDKEQQEKQSKRDDARLEKERQKNAAKKKSVAEGGPYDLPGIDYPRPGDTPRKKPSGNHNPYPYSQQEDDAYFREIFRKKREAAKKAEQDKESGVAEGEHEFKGANGPLSVTSEPGRTVVKRKEWDKTTGGGSSDRNAYHAPTVGGLRKLDYDLGDYSDERSMDESRMSELDAEYKDYKKLSPREFFNMYRVTKQAWLAKYKSMLPQQETVEGQQWPDTTASLAQRKVVVPNLAAYRAGETGGTKAGRPGGMTVATRVDPSITPTSVKKLGSDRPVPSFLQKGVAEADKKKEDDLEPKIKDVALQRAISRAKADFPTAGSGIEALSKDFMRSQDQDQQNFDQLRQAERKQDQMLGQIAKIDQEQEQEINNLDNQNSTLASRLQQLQNVNGELEKKLAAMSGRRAEKKSKTDTATAPAVAPTPVSVKTAEPAVNTKTKSKIQAEPTTSKAIGQIANRLSPPAPSAAIDQMAQQLQPRQKELDFDNNPVTLKTKKFDTSRATDVVARDPREIAKDVKQNIQQYGSDLAGSRSDALRNLVAQDELPMENNDKEAKYSDKYQDMVARVGQKAREQEKSKPVDIKDLARRLAAIEASRKD